MEIKENRERDKLVKERMEGLEKRTESGGLSCFKVLTGKYVQN